MSTESAKPTGLAARGVDIIIYMLHATQRCAIRHRLCPRRLATAVSRCFMSTDVECSARGGTYSILMNRPKALNALNLPMIRSMAAAYEAAIANPSVHAVVLEGAGGKAFCAGGDVKGIWEAARSGEPIRSTDADAFFREEYILNAAIACSPKPQISLWGTESLESSRTHSIPFPAPYVTSCSWTISH